MGTQSINLVVGRKIFLMMEEVTGEVMSVEWLKEKEEQVCSDIHSACLPAGAAKSECMLDWSYNRPAFSQFPPSLQKE